MHSLFLPKNNFVKLKKILLRKRYVAVKLTKIGTNHFVLKAKVNGVKGHFILDTGASNSCIGLHLTEAFLLQVEDSDTKVAGAGTTGIETKLAAHNTLDISGWIYKNFTVVLLELSHITEALKEYYPKPIHGIIGAEILEQGNAIIDYKKQCVYLKKLVYKF